MLWFEQDKEKQKAEEWKTKYERALFHRKSSEVRLGKIGENLAPFVKAWPWDPKNFRFLGNPIDGVQFNDDEIIFIEIKTGGARLSRSQKDFRDIVRAGKVSFVTFKITENGTELVQEGVKL
jgi:predicted Holliday junction resolvase-like endonuclease